MTTLVPVSIGFPRRADRCGADRAGRHHRHGPAPPTTLRGAVHGREPFSWFSCRDVRWLAPAERQVTVMVDLSPSTRGAGFRQLDLLRNRGRSYWARRNPKSSFSLIAIQTALSTDRSAWTKCRASRPSSRRRPRRPSCSSATGAFPCPRTRRRFIRCSIHRWKKAQDAAIRRCATSAIKLAVAVSNNGSPRAVTLHGVLGEARNWRAAISDCRPVRSGRHENLGGAVAGRQLAGKTTRCPSRRRRAADAALVGWFRCARRMADVRPRQPSR